MSVLQAIILAIVEGLTEFLPVSSTGHMVVVSALMGIEQNDFVKVFNVCIQFGAILAVVVLYFKRFFKSIDFYYRLFVAFIPAMIAGLLFNHMIKHLLGSVATVGASLFIGGIILLFIDKWLNKNDDEEKVITYPNAFIIGCFQVLAMIPGVSRSASTIIGGMTRGLSRKQAAEFSFFLAVPTMFGAMVKDLYDNRDIITTSHINFLILGNIIAFIVAMLAIKAFVSILVRYGFKWFGVYRIIVGAAILITVAFGFNFQIG